MKQYSRLVIFLCCFLIGGINSSSYTDGSFNSSFEGLWIRKSLQHEKFDPFAPDYLIIEHINNCYLVIAINSIVEGDRILSETTSHLYRVNGSTIVCSGNKLPFVSTIRLLSSGELIETIDINEIGETGEYIYTTRYK